jgi:tetratricopeptide (TPR) repeat protein
MQPLRIVVAALVLWSGPLGACPPTAWADEPQPAADRIRVLLDRAGAEFAAGRPDEAIASAEAAVSLASAAFGESDELRIDACLALSSLLMQSGRMDDAARLAEEANAGAERNLAHWQDRVAATLKFLGTVHSMRGDLEESWSAFRRAVDLSTIVHGRSHPETAKHLGNLAMIEIRRGDAERGRSLLQETIAIWNAQPDPHPVYLGGAMMNLASLELDEGDAEGALELCRGALALQEVAFGPDNPRLANTLRRYAAMLREAGREDDASRVEVRLETLGDG